MSLKMNVREKLDDDTLDLSMCDLQEIPVREIAAIRKASHLDLSNNRLESLPKTFVTLTQIVKLDLSKNMLSEIPENFGEMRQLRHLDLYGNRISRLPLSLGDLKNLKWLDLKENPLTPAVASVAGSCSNASECQACARNIVSYLANVKRTVEEEKQRRINAVTTVESEEESAPPKKESKKKKKKAAESKSRTRGDKPVSNSESQNNHRNAQKEIPERSRKSEQMSSPRKGGIAGKLCGALTSLVIWLTLVALIIVSGIAILPLFNKNYSDTLTEYIELKTGVNVKPHEQLCTKIVETGIESAVLWAERAQAFVRDTYDSYAEGVSTSAKREL